MHELPLNLLELLGVDPLLIETTINEAIALNDNEMFFERLLAVSRAKKRVSDALELLESQEREIKGLINVKAKTLIGNDWQTIVGHGYKITRSKTGVLYSRNPDEPVNKKFIEIKEVLNSKAIQLEVEKTGKLPKGIEVNPTRGESIKIAVTDDEDA